MQYNKSVKCNKKAYFAHSHQNHHTPAAPFLSIADNIAAVYQKKGNKTKYLAAPIVEGDG